MQKFKPHISMSPLKLKKNLNLYPYLFKISLGITFNLIFFNVGIAAKENEYKENWFLHVFILSQYFLCTCD